MSLTILDENALMLSSWCVTHLEHQILKTRCLRRRPMDSREPVAWGYSRQIKDQISNLSVEYIGSSELESISAVLISINQPKAAEVGRWLQDWQAVWVSDDLGIVVVDDRGRDEVCARWEIDDCWGCCASLA